MFRATITEVGVSPAGHVLRITAHKLFGGRVTEVTLSEHDFQRLKRWQTQNLSIQNVFPEWSASKRELFMTGMNDDDWDKITAADENGD